MSTAENTLELGVLRVIAEKYRSTLNQEQLERVTVSASRELKALSRENSALTLQIYDKNARSQKVVAISKTPEHEQDRNR